MSPRAAGTCRAAGSGASTCSPTVGGAAHLPVVDLGGRHVDRLLHRGLVEVRRRLRRVDARGRADVARAAPPPRPPPRCRWRPAFDARAELGGGGARGAVAVHAVRVEALRERVELADRARARVRRRGAAVPRAPVALRVELVLERLGREARRHEVLRLVVPALRRAERARADLVARAAVADGDARERRARVVARERRLHDRLGERRHVCAKGGLSHTTPRRRRRRRARDTRTDARVALAREVERAVRNSGNLT